MAMAQACLKKQREVKMYQFVVRNIKSNIKDKRVWFGLLLLDIAIGSVIALTTFTAVC